MSHAFFGFRVDRARDSPGTLNLIKSGKGMSLSLSLSLSTKALQAEGSMGPKATPTPWLRVWGHPLGGGG